MLIDSSVKEFTEVLASPEPVPGGGGASALIGAIGISLGDMVGELTTGKKKYAEVEEDIQRLMAKAQELRVRFLAFVDGDAEVFAPLAKAYSIPKDDPDRDAIMEDALRLGCSVPMDIMRCCAEALDVIEEFAAKGSRLAVSDAGCAAVACKAAMQAASLNVFINTKSMKDRDYAEALNAEAHGLLNKYEPVADAIYTTVSDSFGQ
ncbi:MAG: cyclodeaminase/cyclohydrolase family protein [Mogibacterium sp.]|nr:cyclodeaminase/cyclohydrolase family protein [Mogibacterium sp.]